MPCVAYPRQTGPVEVGDTVLVNTQGRDLGLGSGGFDIVYANLTRGLGLPPAPGGARDGASVHARAVRRGMRRGARRAGGDARRACRSSAAACTASSRRSSPASAPGVRIAYVQLAGGALPVALSDTVRLLKTRQLLETAVAVAPCFDGDVQALTPASALAWAKAQGVRRRRLRDRARASSAAARRSGTAAWRSSDAANAAAALGGRADRRRPVLGPRPARAPRGRLAPHALRAQAHPRRARGRVARRPRA